MIKYKCICINIVKVLKNMLQYFHSEECWESQPRVHPQWHPEYQGNAYVSLYVSSNIFQEEVSSKIQCSVYFNHLLGRYSITLVHQHINLVHLFPTGKTLQHQLLICSENPVATSYSVSLVYLSIHSFLKLII